MFAVLSFRLKKGHFPMKLDRLIGILSVLLQRDTVTAPELAARFEVSRRTIGRDIDALCRAGIPIATRQGANGGISIMNGYKLDKTLLTDAELRDILAGLKSLDSVDDSNCCGRLMEKLSAGSSGLMATDQSVLIDLSSWYRPSLAPKITLIRAAIDACMEVRFLYYTRDGEHERSIEPYHLVFHWSSWYVWGWCRLRRDYRLFKLNRMEMLQTTGAVFSKRAAPLPDLSDGRVFPGGIHVRALFEADCKWRLIEEFGAHCFEQQADGKLLFSADYTDQEHLIAWLLAFGEKAELLEPAPLRREMRDKIEKMKERYAT